MLFALFIVGVVGGLVWYVTSNTTEKMSDNKVVVSQKQDTN